MRKLLLFALVAIMLVTMIPVLSFAKTNTNLPTDDKNVSKGYIELDVTDLSKEFGLNSLFEIMDSKDCGRPKLTYRLGENVKAAIGNWNFSDPKAFRPDLLAYLRNDNVKNSAPSYQTLSSSNEMNPFAINQPMPPAGTITWDWGNSQNPGANPTDPEWQTVDHIRNFILGGGGITTGMQSCINDVFGSPMFNVTIRIYKDGTGAVLNGAAGMYFWSTGVTNLQSVIWLRPEAGLAPNTLTPWGTFSQEERLEVLTHEIIHAYYDQLNFMNIHPWTEGITECQSILARRLWFQRNGYNDTFFNAKYHLQYGAPTTLATYELNNHQALAAYARQFYTSNAILQPRMQSMGAIRYQYSATAWWKIWRETTTGLIDNANNTTYGPTSFFVRFNSRYFDYAALNGGVYFLGAPNARSNIPALNQITVDTLNDIKGNPMVENEDFVSDWYPQQWIFQDNSALGVNLFVPNGPATPAGGYANPNYPVPNRSRIDDIGTMYQGNHNASTWFGMTWAPIMYQTFVAGGSSGEQPVAGTSRLQIISMHNNGGFTVGQDVTAEIGYHPGYLGAAPPGWQAIPNPVMTFNGNPMGTPSWYDANPNQFGQWMQLRFDNNTNGGAALPATGAYQLLFNNVAGANTSLTTTYFADGEQIAGHSSGIIIGGGNVAGSTISIRNFPPGNAFNRVAFGNDASFNSNNAGSDAFVTGTRLGYEFRDANTVYSQFSYANTGWHYYVHLIETGASRFTESIGPWEGRIGHAIIAQSTNWEGLSDPIGVTSNPNHVYYCQYLTEQSPGFIGITNALYRPDYLPMSSELVSCFIYANSVGQNVGGNYVEQPAYINDHLSENQVIVNGRPRYEVLGQLIGRSASVYGNPTKAGCRQGGFGLGVSFFRFDITHLIKNIYDPIRVTHLFQDFEPSQAGRGYGFVVVMIFRNNNLPQSKIMVRDGAINLYNMMEPAAPKITFTGFRTPQDPANWPVDNASAGAYVSLIGMDLDWYVGYPPAGGTQRGMTRVEMDYWSYASNNMPAGKQFWPNTQPADYNNAQGGAWWALGNRYPTNVTFPTSAQFPTGIPNYTFSPRAWRQGAEGTVAPTAYYAWGVKQLGGNWFWDRPFPIAANKTAIHWRTNQWWDWVNADWAPNGNPGNLLQPSRSYLLGDDSTITIRPFGPCANPANPGDVLWEDPSGVNPGGTDDGRGFCVGAPIPNDTGGYSPPGFPPSPGGTTCRPPTGVPGTNYSFYPGNSEYGHFNAVILQVPIVPSLTVEKLCEPNPVLPEGVITYTVIVRNDSPYPNVAPVVQEIYPAGVTFIDSTPAPDIGNNIWNKSIRKAIPLGTPPYSDDEGVLQPFESFTITIRVRAGKLPRGTLLTNVVNAYSRTSPSVVSAICQISVLGEPFVTITKTTKKFMAQQGEKVDYTITIQNTGTREATDISVVDLLPRELEYVQSIPSGSAGLQKVTWAFGLLNPGQTIRITLTLRIRRDIRLNPGITINNIAVVTTKSGLRDEDAAMIILRGGPSDVIVCECPDISINFAGMKNIGGGVYEIADNGKVKIGMHPYGGCGPYAMTVDFEDDGKIEYSFNIENDSDKEFDYNLKSGDYTMVVRSADRYGSSSTRMKPNYTFKVCTA